MATAVAETNMFQCGVCKRHYKRLDHLARHVRSRESLCLQPEGARPPSCSLLGWPAR
jgi:hypothetical protein